MQATQQKPKVTFTKFDGEWMVRSSQFLYMGDVVDVEKRNGEVSEVTVGDVIKTFNNRDGKSYICPIIYS